MYNRIEIKNGVTKELYKAGMCIMNSNKIIIIEKAAEIFSQKGYFGTGINEIVKSAQIPKGSFYYYFPDGKEQLVIETLWYSYNNMMKSIKEDFFKNAQTASELFINMINTLEMIVEKKYLESLTITLIGIETSQSNSRINLEVQKIYETWQNEYEQMLIEFGLSKKEASQYRIFYFSIVHGSLISSYIKHNNEDLKIVKNIIQNI